MAFRGLSKSNHVKSKLAAQGASYLLSLRAKEKEMLLIFHGEPQPQGWDGRSQGSYKEGSVSILDCEFLQFPSFFSSPQGPDFKEQSGLVSAQEIPGKDDENLHGHL